MGSDVFHLPGRGGNLDRREVAPVAGTGGLPYPDQHYDPPAGGAQIPGARGLVRAIKVVIAGTPPASGLLVTP
jgi:hypothetical protein